MDILALLKANHTGTDVHVLDVTEGYQKHVGYYFWNAADKVHTLKLIASMRKDDGWEVQDIRELCALCLPAYVEMVDGQYKMV